MLSNALGEVREMGLTKPVNDMELQGVIRSQTAKKLGGKVKELGL